MGPITQSQPKHRITARLFLIGCPRSGTTLLQSLLAAHPEVASFPESHFFPALVPTSRWRRALRLTSPGARKRLRFFLEEIGAGSYAGPPDWIAPIRWYARRFTDALDKVTRRRNRHVWLEKTPRHLNHIDTIARYVPDARFIHLIRNGKDVVASLYAVTHEHPDEWGGTRDVEQCLKRWLRDATTTQRYADHAGHAVVCYENLIDAPEATLRRLCSFAGLDYQSSMLQNYHREARAVTREAEDWKERSRDAIQNTNDTKFYEWFDEATQQYIRERVAEIDREILCADPQEPVSP